MDNRASRVLGVVIELLILLLVVLAPWAFGATEPFFEFLLFVGVSILLLLWAARLLVRRELAFKKCTASLLLLGIFLFGAYQLIRLPFGLLEAASPATARLYRQLLPATHERIEAGDPAVSSTGGTLSISPGATFRTLVQLLAVIALFAVARNNIEPMGGLRRLAFVALCNGALLAVVGLLQRFSSPADTIYWSFKSPGTVFGPFINRNHFAFYANICIGLGLGALLSLRGRRQAREDGPRRRRKVLGGVELPGDPAFWWISAALVVMIAGVVFSLSRGGTLALVMGLALFALLCLRRPTYVAAGALVVGMAVTLGLSLGPQAVEKRLATLGDAETLQASRLDLWQNAWPLVAEFPLWGTGYGTFSVVEPLHSSNSQSFTASHAENEYLEALVEGGVVRLLLSLLAIGYVGYRGYLALQQRSAEAVEWGLVLGGLVAFVTVVVHSCVDFGLHVPAITVLTVVACAYLVGAAEPRPTEAGVDSVETIRWRGRGLAPLAAALGLLLVAGFLCRQGWRAVEINRYRVAAMRLRNDPEPEARHRQIAYLAQASRLGPDYARVYAALGQAHSNLFERMSKAAERDLQVARHAQHVLDHKPISLGAGPAQVVSSAVISALANNRALNARNDKLRQEQLVPGMRAFLHARDLCPVLPQPHMRIALHVDLLAHADPRQAYLDRAHALAPSSPDYWYVSGLVSLLDGQHNQALVYWRRALELSDTLLPTMLANVRGLPDEKDFVKQLLPAEPEAWLAAAFQLYPEPEAGPRRRPYLEHALELFAPPSSLNAEQLRIKGLVLFALDRPDDGLVVYREALSRPNARPEWRYELAAQLLKHDRPFEASREFRGAFQRLPDHKDAARLRKAINQAMAGQKR